MRSAASSERSTSWRRSRSPGLRRALEEREAVAARPRRLEQLAVVVEVEAQSAASSPTPSRPRPRAARAACLGALAAPRRTCPRSRSRSRAGRRRAARAGSSRRPARYVSAWTTPAAREHRVERADRDAPCPSAAARAAAVRKRIASGCVNARQHELVRHLLAERLPQRDLDEVDADRVADEVGHLAAGDPRRDLDDARPSRRRRRSAAGTRSRRAARARARRARRRAPPRRARRRRSRRGRRGSSRRRSRSRAGAAGRRASARCASPPRAITMPFSSSPSWKPSTIASPVGDSASAACRCASRSSVRLDVEDAALAARVGRLQHRRQRRPSSSARAALGRSRAPAKRGCGTPASASVRRIAILCVIRCAVSVPIPGSPSASATAATTGRRGRPRR